VFRWRRAASIGAALLLLSLIAASAPTRAQDQPILLDLSGPLHGVAGQPLTFVAIVPSLPDTPAALAFTWSASDGAAADGPILTHAFTTPGTYTVTLAAHDLLHPATSATTSQEVTIAATADDLPDTPPDGAVLLRNDAGETHGWALAWSDAAGTLHLRVALADVPVAVYGVSACRATTADDVDCLPAGTPLGLRFCQTQDPNTGVPYCVTTDDSGGIPGGSFERPYPNLPFTANLVLVWNLDDGTDWYRAEIGPGVPAQLTFPNALPPVEID
jgi:hypothetical protein